MLPSADEFLTEVKMSSAFFVIVEGGSDRTLFELYFRIVSEREKFPQETKDAIGKLVVESCDAFVGTVQGLGNREKLENFAAEAEEWAELNNITCLADREFREFNYSSAGLVDELTNHQRSPRLYWTAGHSIENYTFKFEILKDGLIEWCARARVNGAKVVYDFEKHIESVLWVACARSRTGVDFGLRWTSTNAASEWRQFEYSGGGFSVDSKKWAKKLMMKSTLGSEQVEAYVEAYDRHLERMAGSGIDLLGKFLHGHVGERTLWDAFRGCCAANTESNSVTQKVLKRPSAEDRLVRNFSSFAGQGSGEITEGCLGQCLTAVL
jgi:hypothetical protein